MNGSQAMVREHDLGKKKIQVVDLAGVLDVYTTHHFEEAVRSLIARGNYWFVINFGECNYISSAGLGAIIGIAKELRRHEGDIRLTRLPGKILDIVKILGFHKFLKIYSSEKEAVFSFKV